MALAVSSKGGPLFFLIGSSFLNDDRFRAVHPCQTFFYFIKLGKGRGTLASSGGRQKPHASGGCWTHYACHDGCHEESDRRRVSLYPQHVFGYFGSTPHTKAPCLGATHKW